MSSDSEILIQIRTALESGGIDAAKAKIGELTQETEKNSTAGVGNAAQNAKAVQTLNALRGAANGNISSLAKLSGETNALGGALMKASIATGAFMAGWQAGLKIGDWMWPKIMKLDEFDKTTLSIRDRAKEAVKGLEELNKVRMEELLKNLDDVNGRLADIFDKTEGKQKRETRLTQEQQRAEMATFEAGWAGKDKGPEYERQKAALEQRQAEAMSQLQMQQLVERENDIVKAREELNKTMASVKADEQKALDAAKKAEAKAKGGSDEDIIAAQTTAEAAKQATARRQEMEGKTSGDFKKLDRQMFDIETDRQALGIAKGATSAQYRGAMAGADRSASDAQAQAEKESLRRKLEAEDAAREKEIEAARSGLDPLQQAAQSAASMADSYKGSAGLKGRPSRSAIAAADARDQELERVKLEAAARVAAHQATIEALIAADKAKDEATKRLLDEKTSQNVNLPV